MKAIFVILNRFAQTIVRFPLPTLAGVLAFIFLIIEIHFSRGRDSLVHDYRYVKLFLASMSAISLYIAFDIFCESQDVKPSTRLGLYLLGFCVLGMHYFSITPGMFDSETIFISRYLIFIACFHLLISFLAFSKSSQIHSFWQFNYMLLKRIITSFLYSITLFCGLASGIWALDKLFNIHINPDYYTDLFAFIFLVFNTLFFLNGWPKSYTEFSKPIEFKKSVRIFVQYVLLPIVAIYISILYLYMAKIIVTQQLPKGWVCVPILIFSVIGILAYLLVYPIRLDRSNRLIYIYSKYFFYILLPLLSLYFIAIIMRIKPYGITEDRYLIFMLGVWLVIISVYIIMSKVDNIIVVPMSLFILLAISAVGPWGMYQLSVANQVMRLERLLKRNHLLENGKLVKLDKKYTVSKVEASSIRSIFSFLNKRGEINQVHTWLGEEDQIKLDSAIVHNDLVYINSIFSDLGPEENAPYELYHYFVCHENRLDNHSISTSGYAHIGQFNCNKVFEDVLVDTTSAASLVVDNLHYKVKGDSLLILPLKDKFLSLLNYYQYRDSNDFKQISGSSTLKVINAATQEIALPADTMTLVMNGTKLVFNTIEFVRIDTTYSLRRVEGYILY